TTEDVAEETEAQSNPEEKPQINQELYENLRRWRLERARKDQVAPFIIAHNKLLESLAANPPATATKLLATPGFGQKKLETYGEDLLKILSDYAEPASEQENEIKPQNETWTKAKDKKLLELFKAKVSLAEICLALDSSPEIAWKRIAILLNPR
ncbi:MAG: HRDC domain-containing protein, partial [Candidatus Saccharimonadales bacterium]